MRFRYEMSEDREGNYYVILWAESEDVHGGWHYIDSTTLFNRRSAKRWVQRTAKEYVKRHSKELWSEEGEFEL